MLFSLDIFTDEKTKVDIKECADGIYLACILSFAQGGGSKKMREILAYAKQKRKPVYLFASGELGSDLRRLRNWYLDLGFTQTKRGFFHDYLYDFVYKGSEASGTV